MTEPESPASPDPLSPQSATASDASHETAVGVEMAEAPKLRRQRPSWLSRTNIIGSAVILILIATVGVCAGGWSATKKAADVKAKSLSSHIARLEAVNEGLNSSLSDANDTAANCKSAALNLTQAMLNEIAALTQMRLATASAAAQSIAAATVYVNASNSSQDTATGFSTAAKDAGCQ